MDLLAVDTETTGLDPWLGDRVFAIILCDTQGRSLYVCLDRADHYAQSLDGYQGNILLDQQIADRTTPDFPGEGQGPHWARVQGADWRIAGDLPCLKGAWTLDKVRDLLGGSRPKVFHNAKFDLRMMFWTFGWFIGGLIHDTLLLARIMLPSKRGLGLKVLGDEVLQMPAHEEMEVQEWLEDYKKEYLTDKDRLPCYMDVSSETMEPYAIGDVHRTMLLLRLWWRSLHDKRIEIYEYEMRVMFSVMRMEDMGMRIDMEYTEEVYLETERRISDLDHAIWKIIGKQFNVNSDQQCAKYILRDPLNLRGKVSEDVWKDHSRVMTTDKGALSVSRDALKVYREYDDTGICDKLMLRNMLVGMDAYYKNFMEGHYLNSKGQYIVRPSILQFTAVTGRFSIVEPALQTIPSRSSGRLLDFERDAIPDVRRCFVPTYPSWPMYAWDYSQLELRLIAFYANEEAMIQAYANEEDVHDMTTWATWEGRIDERTKLLIDLEDEEVWKRCRTFCKMVNFGLAYGMQEDKFHQELHTPMDVVRRVIKDYNTTYPGISGLMDAVKSKVYRDGYLHNIFGRLLLPSRSKAYSGVNYLVQSTGADIIKRAIVHLDDWAISNSIRIAQLVPVHDEIIKQIHPDDDTHEVRLAMKAVMEDFPEFAPLPIVVGCKRIVGHWSHKEEVDFGKTS